MNRRFAVLRLMLEAAQTWHCIYETQASRCENICSAWLPAKTKVFTDSRVRLLRWKPLNANYNKKSVTISSNCTPHLVAVTDVSEKRNASMLTGTAKTTSRRLRNISEKGMTYGYVENELYGETCWARHTVKVLPCSLQTHIATHLEIFMET
jgi:hypothetical protein